MLKLDPTDEVPAAVAAWMHLGSTFDPTDPARMLRLKGKPYMTVQQRLIWFIRDQRHLILNGLQVQPYAISTTLVLLDRAQGWAHYKGSVRDVLGNEATMYGSESERDFPDYIEKASTKALGRSLLLLGYGTAYAAEIDDGALRDAPPAKPARGDAPVVPAGADAAVGATPSQIASIQKIAAALGIVNAAGLLTLTGVAVTADPNALTTAHLSAAEAVTMLRALSTRFNAVQVHASGQR